MGCHFPLENTVGETEDKGFAEVLVDYANSLSLIHQVVPSNIADEFG